MTSKKKLQKDNIYNIPPRAFSCVGLGFHLALVDITTSLTTIFPLVPLAACSTLSHNIYILVNTDMYSRILVMVSSELVVLLIVCVGINTGSAQGELATNTHKLC